MSNSTNIPKERLAEIKADIEGVESFMSDCIIWVENSPNVLESKPISKALKVQRRRLRKTIDVIELKPSIALFGASQSGKSNLAKNLMKDKNEKICFIKDAKENRDIDFFTYINPEGRDNESTALVTRFTKYTDSFKEFPKPVKIKLLDIKDIILCICDGFYTVAKLENIDLDFTERIQTEIKKISEVKSSQVKQRVLNEDDIYDIKEYLENYFGSKAQKFLFDLQANHYWEHLAANIKYIETEEIKNIFEFLWMFQTEFSRLFQRLLEVANRLSFANYIYCDYNLVFRQLPTDYTFDNYTNILDVVALDNILDNADSFEVITPENEVISLPSNLICAISREVILPVPANENGVIKISDELDVLDFPGIRPATKISINKEITNKQLSRSLLRGKVNYLFNSYSENLTINSLAIVTAFAKQSQGAELIPDILKKWIDNYIGEDTKKRSKSIDVLSTPPLFLILTFWNKLFEFEKGATLNPEIRMINAFEKRISEGILSDHLWPNNWIDSNGRLEKFKNFYLLRDLDYCKAYQKDENENEVSLDSFQEEYFYAVKDYFLQMRAVKDYFANPQLNWNESATPNKDGSQLIVDNLLKITSNHSKTSRLVNIANEAYNVFMLEMPKAKNGDIGSMISKAKQKAQDVESKLGSYVEEGYSLGKIQELYIVSENDIYENLLVTVKSHNILSAGQIKKYFTFLMRHPELRNENTDEDKLSVLAKKWGYDNDEMKKYLEQEMKFELGKLFSNDIEKLKKKSTYIADEMKNFWIEEIINKEIECIDSEVVSISTIKRIGSTLRDNFNELDMTDKIADSIKEYVDDVDINDYSYFMVSNIIAGMINNFVMTAGWKYTPKNKQEEIKKRALENDITTYEFTLNEEESLEKVSQDTIKDVFNFLENEVKLINESVEKNDTSVIQKSSSLFGLNKWQDCLKLSFMANVDSADYDIESNNKLKTILSKQGDLVVSL